MEWNQIQSAEKMEEELDREIQKNRVHNFRVRVLDAYGKPCRGMKLRAVHRNHDFTFGVCPNGHISMTNHLACGEDREAEIYWERIGALFNAVTLWWGWRVLEPERGIHTFDRECGGYGPMERMIRRAESLGQRITAHALLYPRDDVSPQWLAECTEEEARKALETHVRETVERYRDRISCWHPVNEAYDEIQKAGNLRVNEGLVYRWVSDLAPHASIVDNGGHTIDPDFYEKGIRNAGLFGGRVDDLGIRGYFELYDSGAVSFYKSIWEHFGALAERYHRNVRFTEIGASSAQRPGAYSTWDVDPTTAGQLGIANVEEYREGQPITEETQADFLVRMYKLAFAHPAVKECTYWDLCDTYTWNETEGGLIRPDLSPKPAYERLRKLIRGIWKTEAVLETDADGCCEFDGFDGEYEVELAARQSGEDEKALAVRKYRAEMNSEHREYVICAE